MQHKGGLLINNLVHSIFSKHCDNAGAIEWQQEKKGCLFVIMKESTTSSCLFYLEMR